MKEIEDFERQEQENKGFNQKFNINPDKQKEILAKQEEGLKNEEEIIFKEKGLRITYLNDFKLENEKFNDDSQEK